MLFGVIGAVVGPFVGVAASVVGLALLVTTLFRQARRPGPAILGVAVSLIIAGGFFAAYGAVGSAAAII